MCTLGLDMLRTSGYLITEFCLPVQIHFVKKNLKFKHILNYSLCFFSKDLSRMCTFDILDEFGNVVQNGFSIAMLHMA